MNGTVTLHLSNAGSKMLAERMQLAKLIGEQAK
jgi:hypothetical protein